MCSCHSIIECCVTFSGVKLSIRSFVLFLYLVRYKAHIYKLPSNSFSESVYVISKPYGLKSPTY